MFLSIKVTFRIPLGFTTNLLIEKKLWLSIESEAIIITLIAVYNARTLFLLRLVSAEILNKILTTLFSSVHALLRNLAT